MYDLIYFNYGYCCDLWNWCFSFTCINMVQHLFQPMEIAKSPFFIFFYLTDFNI